MINWSIRRHHHHARTIRRPRTVNRPPPHRRNIRINLPQLFSHRHSGNHQVAPEICLHQHSHRVPSQRIRQPPRRSPNPSLPRKRNCSRSRSHHAFFHWPFSRIANRSKHILGRNRPRANVAQISIVRLAHHRIHRNHFFISRQLEHVGNQVVRHFKK